MQPVQVTTVILGSWNPKIFTPSWIKLNLFGLLQDQDIQGMVNFEDMEFGFQYDGISIFPRPNLVDIIFEGYDKAKAATVASIVIKILELLPQTPVKALGVNIKYAIPRNDNSQFGSAITNLNVDFGDFKVNQIRQSLNKDGYQINIITDLNSETINPNFNFHYAKLSPLDPNFINAHYEETQKILSNGN